jgi:small GTP-binding protein
MGLLKFASNSAARFHKLDEPKDSRVLIVGLNGAGKTSILSKICSDATATKTPTVGFTVGGAQFRNMNITLWDIVSQNNKARSIWRHHFVGAQGLVFVLDSSDCLLMDQAKVELEKILNEKNMRNMPVLVLANKQDLPGALSADKVARKLGLRHQRCLVHPVCGLSGAGIAEGFDWLASELESL